MPDPALGARTGDDLHSAPEVMLAVLDRLDGAAAALAPRCTGGVRFLGCGSSHLGGGLAAALLQRVAQAPAHAVVGSEAAFYVSGLPPAPLALAMSRSGATSETLAAVQAHRQAGGGPVVALVCDPASPLASRADEVIAVPEAAEDVVAQTRSVATFLMFSVLLAGHAAGLSPAPAVRAGLQSLAATRPQRDARAAAAAPPGAGGIVVLGGGLRWWVAREMALKLIEMGQVPASTERVMEYPHGPVEGLDRSTTVVAFRSAEAAAVEGPVLDRLETLAGSVVRLGADGSHDAPGASGASGSQALLLDAVRLLGELHDGHLLALHTARARGIDADAPAQIASHITLAAT